MQPFPVDPLSSGPMMLDQVYIAEQNQGMDDQPETTTDSQPKRFQFTIVNFFEATIACSVLILIIIPSGFDVPFVVGYLTFYALKSLITIVGVKRKLIGVLMYAALWVLVLAIFHEAYVLPVLVSLRLLAVVPTATFAFDLTGSFVRPRTIIWRPIAEFLAFLLWIVCWSYAPVVVVR